MKTFITPTLILILLLGFSFGQERYNPGDFSSLVVSSGVSVELEASSYNEINNPNNVPIEVSQEGEKLVIRMKNGSYNLKGKKTVYLKYNRLNAVSVNGGANVHASQPIRSSNLKLTANGGGNLHLMLANNNTVAKASGGGNIHLNGSSNMLNLHTSGGGNIHASDFDSRAIDANASSGGNIHVNAGGSNLQAVASSGGNIVYTGNPTAVNVNKSNGGRVVGNKSKVNTTTTVKKSKPKVAY